MKSPLLVEGCHRESYLYERILVIYRKLASAFADKLECQGFLPV